MSSVPLSGALLVLVALLPSAACGGLDDSEPGARQLVTGFGIKVKSPWYVPRDAGPVVDAACVPDCSATHCGADGCGGSCGRCGPGTLGAGGASVTMCVSPWSPFWRQTAQAGTWWAEFRVAGGGSVARSLLFEVVGGASTTLTLGGGRWAGALNGVAAGTSVVLHATDATGATAQTLPFRYLVDSAPVTDQCRGTPSASACKPLRRGMVTFTMDDSYESQALLAGPVLVSYGFKATFYQITGHLEAYGLLPAAQALAADGNEIGSHSRTHPNLNGLTPEDLTDELLLSKQYLLTNVGPPAESFASPMGAFNHDVVAAIKLHYASNRGVYPGLNYVGSDVYRLNADVVTGSTTVSSVCAQLAEAAAHHGWRILVFHDFTSAATTSSTLTYPIADFAGILACAQSTPRLDVVTTLQGVALLACATP